MSSLKSQKIRVINFNKTDRKMVTQQKDKVLRKMYDKGLVTSEEITNRLISPERYDMFVAGIDLINGIDKDPYKLLEEYGARLGDDNHNQTEVKKQVRKLKKLLSKKSYSKETTQAVLEFTPTKSKTQKEEVIRHLNEEGFITSFDAFLQYGITRLSAIIYVLRHNEGLNITTTNVTEKNRYGNLTNFAKYSIND